jgi:uncharacterized protein (DUF433 family)
MNWQDYIVQDEEILVGKPTIKGTRLSVESLIGLLAQGWTYQQILDNYPTISDEHMKALFLYIQDCIKDGLMFKRTN